MESSSATGPTYAAYRFASSLVHCLRSVGTNVLARLSNFIPVRIGVRIAGLSIAGAAGATGETAALVKVNNHRGLKKLAALFS